MNKARKIAIAGATGMVGQSFLKLLEKDYFQDSEISLLASSNSAGKEINFRGKNHKVEDLSKFNFSELIEAEGSIPIDPVIMAAISESISPNKLPVTTTSNCLGSLTNCMDALSTNMCERLTSG